MVVVDDCSRRVECRVAAMAAFRGEGRPEGQLNAERRQTAAAATAARWERQIHGEGYIDAYLVGRESNTKHAWQSTITRSRRHLTDAASRSLMC